MAASFTAVIKQGLVVVLGRNRNTEKSPQSRFSNFRSKMITVECHLS